MHCGRCNEDFSPFQSICPNCFGELKPALGAAAADVLSMPTIDFSFATQALPEVSPLDLDFGTLLTKPAEAAREGALQASGQVKQGVAAVSTAVRKAADRVEHGDPVAETVGKARAELLEALDTTGRYLQKTAHQTREAVLRELRREGGDARARAAEMLRSRQAQISKHMHHRLHEISDRFDRLQGALDEADHSSFLGRIESLKRQAGSVLVGLEKEVGSEPVLARVPDVNVMIREAGVNPEKVVEVVGDSAEGVQKGCLSLGGAFASLFLPGLGQLLTGQGGAAMVVFLAWMIVPNWFGESSMNGVMNLLIRVAAAAHVWFSVRSR